MNTLSIPYMLTIMVGSLSGILKMKYSEIEQKLNDDTTSEEFYNQLEAAEQILQKRQKEYRDKHPFIQHSNGGYYKFSYIGQSVFHKGVYTCNYTLVEIPAS